MGCPIRCRIFGKDAQNYLPGNGLGGYDLQSYCLMFIFLLIHLPPLINCLAYFRQQGKLPVYLMPFYFQSLRRSFLKSDFSDSLAPCKPSRNKSSLKGPKSHEYFGPNFILDMLYVSYLSIPSHHFTQRH